MDYGIIASSDPGWIQGEFSDLVGMFDRVGLKKKIVNTVKMVCRPCQVAGTQSEAAYKRRMTGVVPSYW